MRSVYGAALAPAGLALLLLSSAPASAACGTFTFMSGGCFTNYQAHVPFGSGDGQDATAAGYVTIEDNPKFTDPLLNVNIDSNQSGYINVIDVTFRYILDSMPFSLFLDGFAAQSSTLATGSYQTVTFVASVMNSFGAGDQLNFRADGAGTPVYAEIAFKVTNAPAPVPGAGFLSFLALGFSALRRKGRELLSRVNGLRARAVWA